MRLLQIMTFYPAYLADFYRRHPGLQERPSGDQMEVLLEDGFSAGHLIAPHLKAHGYEAEIIIANCMEMQARWAQEHGHRAPVTQGDLFALTLTRVDTFKPDVLYLLDPILHDSRFVNVLKHQPKLIMGWRAAPIAPSADWTRFDLMLSSDAGYREQALMHGARTAEHFMPGFPEQIARRIADMPKSADIAFCGQITGEHMDRIVGLTALAHHAAKSKYATQFHLGIRPHLPIGQELRAVDRGAAWGMDMYGAVRRGRIAPNFHINAAVTRAQNMRLLEITGVGSFLLNEADEHLDQHFSVGKEVETFRNIPELLEKVDYYLAHDSEREAIARRGQERCLRDHSMAKRAVWFDEIVQSALRAPRTARPGRMQTPVSSGAELDSAEALLNNGKIAEAAEALAQIIQREPRNTRALVSMGRVAIAAGQPARAAELFAAARAIGETARP